MSRKAGKVYCKDLYAGIIEEREGGYVFQYDISYLNNPSAKAISQTLPLRAEPYVEKTMIPFFDGLIPEGFLLDVAQRNWKLNERDRMGLLLTLCQDCIGAISVVAIAEKEDEHE